MLYVSRKSDPTWRGNIFVRNCLLSLDYFLTIFWLDLKKIYVEIGGEGVLGGLYVGIVLVEE